MEGTYFLNYMHRVGYVAELNAKRKCEPFQDAQTLQNQDTYCSKSHQKYTLSIKAGPTVKGNRTCMWDSILL